MILPPVVRVFFAIELPEDTKRAIGVYMDTLKKLSKSNKIRWTRIENLHITLQFLAEVKSEDIPVLVSAVTAELAQAESSLQLSLRHLHLFPDPHRPRVVVIDVAPQEVLTKWAALIGKGIQSVGYEIDARPFRAHMSIGRIKTSDMTALNFISAVAPPGLGAINIQEVVLFRSEPHPDGSRYIPLTRIAWGT